MAITTGHEFTSGELVTAAKLNTAVTGQTVTATGSTTARSPADRAADVANVLDYASIQSALDSGKKAIYLPAGTYEENALTVSADDLYIYGEGHVRYTTIGLTVTGDNCTVDGLTFSRASKSASSSMNYDKHGLKMDGSYNSILNVESYNCEGSGLVLSGGYYLIADKCDTHDNITGIRLTSSCRNVKITASDIRENNVNNASGADGILANGNVTGLIVENCDIYDSGEHGIYFQGQEAIFTNNRIRNNDADGLKFGNQYDNAYTYPGETLDKWVDGTHYGVRHVVIANNYIADNGGEDGIYFQPSAKDVVISNNVLKNNRIRCVYFNNTGGDAILEDLLNISIEGNRISGTDAGISVACYEGLKITNNHIDGQIYVNAPNAATTPRLSDDNQTPEITGNTCDEIYLNRAFEAIVLNNTTETFVVGDGSTDVTINGNTIKGLTTSLNTSKVKFFNNNNVIVAGDIAFNYKDGTFSYPFKFSGNTIVGNSYDSDYFISASYNADVPVYGRFSNNYIECTLCDRPIELEGDYCSMTGNTIFGKSSSSNAIDIFGDRMVVTGNVLRYGDIKLRNDTENIVTSNKCNSVIDGVGYTTNIVANNT
jgi:predicted RNA-binding protein